MSLNEFLLGKKKLYIKNVKFNSSSTSNEETNARSSTKCNKSEDSLNKIKYFVREKHNSLQTSGDDSKFYFFLKLIKDIFFSLILNIFLFLRYYSKY